LVGEDEWFSPFEDVALAPVWLVEDEVDVFYIDGFCLCADGFYHACEAEVFDGAEVAVASFVDEVEGVFCEGVVWESCAVELVLNEGEDVCGGKGFEFGGLGDAGTYFVVVAHFKQGHEFGLSDEDEVMIFREVF